MRNIRAANRNPDSVVWEAVLANADADIICIQFRGQNGFGGMARQVLVSARNTLSSDELAWRRSCGGKMQDMIYAKHAL